MDPLLFIAIAAILFFGILSIYFSLKETKITRLLKEKDKKYRRQLLEISALKEIQDNMGHSLDMEKAKLTSLLASLEDGIFMVDENSQITAINKTAKDLLDIQKDNSEITQVLASLPNSYDFGDKIKKAITLKQKIKEKDIQCDNNKLLDITITPMPNGAFFLIHDATTEKTLSRTKEDFTNIIVHELRSPLASIKASAEMLTGTNDTTEEDKKSLIAIINDQAVKMLDEIATILDSSKLDTGLFTIKKTSGDFKNIIEDTIESFRIIAQKKSIDLISHIDQFLPQAKFDSYHMRRCLSNLISNSFKFTPEGGSITVRAWFTPGKIFVSVSDTGSGIPIEKQHLLFSKFTQIHNDNGATTSTGLGLYIVKGIIEAHGGTISLESEPNKGATFTFNIPIGVSTDVPASQSSTLQS